MRWRLRLAFAGFFLGLLGAGIMDKSLFIDDCPVPVMGYLMVAAGAALMIPLAIKIYGGRN